jgi:hypothetical protein
LPAGVTASPSGSLPTVIVSTTWLLAVEITETLFEPWFAT